MARVDKREEEREYRTLYCCVQTLFEEYRGQTDHKEHNCYGNSIQVTVPSLLCYAIQEMAVVVVTKPYVCGEITAFCVQCCIV